MQLVFSRRAEREDAAHAMFLEQHSAPAAVRYGEQLKRLLANIKDNPQIGVAHSDGRTRSMPLKGFPYLVFYQIRETEVLILFIFHTAQDPRRAPQG